MNKKALIAMSGGVDSSVAAYLMKKEGYECDGVTMKLFNNNNDIEFSEDHSCCTEDDVADAKKVCETLNMPFHLINFQERFKEEVIDKFVFCYEHGITPNPCVDCNRYLKFGVLLKKAIELNCDFIVTGHYARIRFDEKSGRYQLLKAIDQSKDQSYVLYSMSQSQLSKIRFPLGDFSKNKTRQIAEEINLINAEKKESQDICFVTDGSYADFIEGYTKKTYPDGEFITVNGEVLGTHRGIIRYTIGQRKGLGLSLKQPMYVKEVNPVKNQVILATNEELFGREVTATNINLISIDKITTPIRVKAKIRYRHDEQWGTATQLDENTIKFIFDEPQRAITKGQALVMYDGDIVVGGGTII